MTTRPPTPVSCVDLVDWKRKVAALYADVREPRLKPEATLDQFRAGKDELFQRHPATPLDPGQQQDFTGISYFDYRPEWRVHGEVTWLEGEESFVVNLPEGDATMMPAADVGFESPISRQTRSLQLYWLKGYGGGLFLPFKDATNSDSTYGGGRYLYDTIKGADLGLDSPLFLDFNYAYNPSCAYSPQWVCPLAPPENVIGEPIEAGEKAWD